MKLAELKPRVINNGMTIPKPRKFATEAERVAARKQRQREWIADLRQKTARVA